MELARNETQLLDDLRFCLDRDGFNDLSIVGETWVHETESFRVSFWKLSDPQGDEFRTVVVENVDGTIETFGLAMIHG